MYSSLRFGKFEGVPDTLGPPPPPLGKGRIQCVSGITLDNPISTQIQFMLHLCHIWNHADVTYNKTGNTCLVYVVTCSQS